MKSYYQKHNEKAGVSTYEILDDAIILEFTDRRFRYLYNAEKTGLVHVDAMKRLALAGNGLTTYINQHVRGNYAIKMMPARG